MKHRYQQQNERTNIVCVTNHGGAIHDRDQVVHAGTSQVVIAGMTVLMLLQEKMISILTII